jgi:DNA adenine methylase
MQANLEKFITKLREQKIEFSCSNFDDFNFSFLSENDFVYCDPPYLITTGTYNDGKRGFSGWAENEENQLLEILDKLNNRGIKFALSNVLEHKGKSNDILKKWLNSNSKYRVNHLNFHYSNSNYQTIVRDKNASTEVLITNYFPKTQKTLFEVTKIKHT